ncbi:GIY-YIG nuclease family protein [Enterobacter hormaechei]|uniref:GIY-YIG nuclease family protein n=1 Tax=Enterobacter hormaechei TaxID=158836 RepID=UPI0012B803BF|nr:GIY-YIG nuclease family protein [Enterobacter hormaechei]MCL8179632.1 GIY-YIG nuclease family protein [Enterobacter hormaechei]MCM7040707.1 GIY-YIG nuclease family protein [Enterobacter hormaechei]MCM7465096.1 GIY-YIG nuclease family protein [Enterobacter hormaechei]MCW4692536.1 GIY-YIG nuclease family protein [Enterobacter hormaechei subsp. hoffmannii]MCW4697046.1 GIY-YIG nuclease family protein [Enterobacter hormaechei subsp. hoffmannii]
MAPGYVYILINPSMPGLIKIGRTLRDSRMRARELFSTGVPTPFQVAFELFAEQHEALEAMVHNELNDFRVNAAREFFRYPLDKAVALLIQLATPLQNSTEQYVAEDITQRLREKYPLYIRPEIVSVRIVQMPGVVWLEITTEKEIAGYLVEQTTQRTDLKFIVDTDEAFFRPEDDVRLNANKLVNDYDIYSVVMTTDLFHDDACQQIVSAYEMHHHSG